MMGECRGLEFSFSGNFWTGGKGGSSGVAVTQIGSYGGSRGHGGASRIYGLWKGQGLWGAPLV